MSDETFPRAPFERLSAAQNAAAFGMWIFLASEVLLFAGLFAGYAVYHTLYPAGFSAGGRATDILYGTLNTAILMTSSLTIAIAGRASRVGLNILARYLLMVTVVLGIAFLAIKGLEYREDLQKRLLPGPAFSVPENGAALFFSFYWVMTGIHALHVTGGIIAVTRLVIASRRDRLWLSLSASEEATALYWHLVDIIWVVLYPLLYLMGRAHG